MNGENPNDTPDAVFYAISGVAFDGLLCSRNRQTDRQTPTERTRARENSSRPKVYLGEILHLTYILPLLEGAEKVPKVLILSLRSGTLHNSTQRLELVFFAVLDMTRRLVLGTDKQETRKSSLRSAEAISGG